MSSPRAVRSEEFTRSAPSQLVTELRVFGQGSVTLSAAPFGPALFLRALSSDHCAERPPRRAHDTRLSTMCVFLGVRSSAELRHVGGGACYLREGDIAIVDSDRGFEAQSSTENEQRILQIPKSVLGERVRGLERIAGHALCGSESKHRAVHGALLQLADATSALSAAEHVPSFIAAMYLIELLLVERAQPDDGYERFRQGCVFIENHLADPQLSTTSIAAAVGVSRRSLEEAFAKQGQTVARMIWERRLARAHDELTADDRGRRKLLSIATSCGFSNAAHFSRTFRQRFGRAPSELRNELMGRLEAPSGPK